MAEHCHNEWVGFRVGMPQPGGRRAAGIADRGRVRGRAARVAAWLVAGVLGLGAVVLAPSAAAGVPSGTTGGPIIDMRTGTFEGRFWVQTQLREPFPLPDQQNSAGAAFSLFTPGGAHLSGITQVHQGQELTMGRFQPDSTVSPGASFPIDVQFTDERRTITFFFDAPPGVDLDPATMTFRGQFASQARATDPPTTTNFPADGAPIPFTNRERDPLAASTGDDDGPQTGPDDDSSRATPDTTSTSDDGGIPLWVWVLVALIVIVALVVAGWFFLRPRPLSPEEMAREAGQVRGVLSGLVANPPSSAEAWTGPATEVVGGLDKIRRSVPSTRPELKTQAEDTYRDAAAMVGAQRKGSKVGPFESESELSERMSDPTAPSEPMYTVAPPPFDADPVDELEGKVGSLQDAIENEIKEVVA